MKIKESDLYKRIIDEIKEDKVKRWKFEFRKDEIVDKVSYTFAKQVKGRGDIDWDTLDRVISNINSRYRKISKSLDKKDYYELIKVDLKNLFAHTYGGPVLTADIVLESGDYITVDEEYFAYDDEWRLSVDRIEVPKFTVEKDLEEDELIEFKGD